MYQFNRLKNYFNKPYNVILVTLVIVLGYLIIIPLLSIVVDTFTVHPSEVRRIRGSQVGEFTTYHWTMVFTGSGSWNLLYKPLINSIVCSIGPCIVAIVLGGGFAWLITRTNIGLKKTLSVLFTGLTHRDVINFCDSLCLSDNSW